MFTGIVKGCFPVRFVERKADFLRYAIDLPEDLRADIQQGGSIAIDGVCQTVVSQKGSWIYLDAIAETLRKTTLDQLQEGSYVNVERPLCMGDEIGGHMLSGHVFGTATITEIVHTGDNQRNTFSCPQEWIKYILPKGFIAINGASLTVGEVDPQGTFTVYFIPETLRWTTLGKKIVGDRVNIEIHSETQTIVDTVERLLHQQKNSS